MNDLCRRGILVLSVLQIALPPTGAYARDVAPASCRDSRVPVKLAPGQRTELHVFVRLCLPPTRPATVQVLVHGITYDHSYWDFPDPTGHTDRYSYVRAALAAGFATLAVDRMGIGRSDHPFSATVGIDENAFVIHQLISDLRRGTVTGPTGTQSFRKVVLVGHSYGTWTSWFETTDWHDVDGVILSGATHHVRVDAVPLVGGTLYPAKFDSAFRGRHLDIGYLTTRRGTRYQDFYAPAAADPAVVALDEATKETITAREAGDFPETISRRLDVRAPVLLVDGTLDSLFCGPRLGGADCSSGSTIVRDEGPYLGTSVPCIDGYALRGGGHDLNFALDAGDWFAVAQDWIARRIGTDAAPAQGCGR